MSIEIPVGNVTGVGPSTAIKLINANVKTAQQLSQCTYHVLIPLGIPKGTAERLIQAAVQLITVPNAVTAIRSNQPQAQQSQPVETIITQAPAEGYNEEDVANAQMCNLELGEYLALSPSGRAREVRLANMQLIVEPPEEDFVNDLNLGDLTARDFLRRERKKDSELKRVQKIQQSEAVTEFAKREVHGHDLKDEPINVHGQRLNKQDEKAPEGAKVDGIVIRRPKRKKTGRRSSEIVQQIVDNILE